MEIVCNSSMYVILLSELFCKVLFFQKLKSINDRNPARRGDIFASAMPAGYLITD